MTISLTMHNNSSVRTDPVLVHTDETGDPDSILFKSADTDNTDVALG